MISILQSPIIDISHPIGDPILTLNSTLGTNEIWLEGASVSKTTYAKLFAIYGTTYGASTTTNFTLPDFRNRALWGSNSFGYIEAGLPNITGSFGIDDRALLYYSGAFSPDTTSRNTGSQGTEAGNAFNFNASLSNSIYGKSTTVQPPSIKIRVKTRYQ